MKDIFFKIYRIDEKTSLKNSKEEIEYCNNFNHQKTKEKKKKAYLLAKEFYTNVSKHFKKVNIRHTVLGKPEIYLENKKSKYDISFSYAKNAIFIGLCKNKKKIGIDIEEKEKKITKEFEQFFLTTLEQKLLRKNKLNPLVFWVLKEAFFKSVGKTFPFKDIIITKIKKGKITCKYSSNIKKIIPEKEISIDQFFFEETDEFYYAICVLKRAKKPLFN